MRVRPFFWLFLVFVCIGILAFAATVQTLAPARLHMQLVQRPTPEMPTTLKVRVTDTQGMTVDGAQISTEAWMTNMRMETDATSTTGEGQGTYLVQIRLSMAGPWMITVTMQADGFTPPGAACTGSIDGCSRLSCESRCWLHMIFARK